MRIGSVLMRQWRRGGFALLVPILLASLADACVLAGLRLFLALVGGADLPAWIPVPSLPVWFFAMLLLVGIRLVALVGKQRTVERMSRWLEALLQLWMHRVIKRLPPSFYHGEHAEASLRVAQEGCRTLVSAVDASAQALQAVLQLVVFLPLLLYISWPLTVALLLGMLPLLSWLQGYLRRLGKGMELRAQSSGRLESLLIHWVELVRYWTLGKELEQTEHRFSSLVKEWRSQSLLLGLRKGLLVQVSDAVAALAVVAVLAFCGWWMHAGGMTGSDLILYAAALILCYKPVKDCLRMIPSLREAGLARDHLALLEQHIRDNISTRKTGVAGSNRAPMLCVRNLDFSFTPHSGPSVFQGFHLECSMDRPLWLRGPNGCGKTTLLRNLAGLERPSRGEILWPSSLKSGAIAFLSHKGVVPSVEFFHPDSRNSVSRSQLLRVLGVQDFAFREGLSAGQRQKLGIAWLFCSDAAVLLLDEPFSFVAQQDRVPILAAMFACAEEHGQWFAIASHDPFPAEWEARFTMVRWGEL